MFIVDKLLGSIKSSFDDVEEHRYKNLQIPLADFLQSAFAMFHLKSPSLNHYRNNYAEREANLQRIYDVNELYSDSALREGIDGIRPKDIQKCFRVPLKELEKQGVMEEYQVLGGYNVVLFDGTQDFCTTSKPCDCCMCKEYRNKKGEVTKTVYYHQALVAVIAHPDHKEVFPVNGEAIVKQDGRTKNDCELNASKRLLPMVRELLPECQHKLIGVFDGLYPNGPHIELLAMLDMRYVIGIREGYVMIQIEDLKKKDALQTYQWTESDGRKCLAQWHNGLILNGQNQHIQTNYFEYTEWDDEGKQLYHNTWITDFPIDQSNVQELIKVGRCRWKIENETFNTLKNQGYHLEHSYGHGEKYLATNFMLLTFMAFLVDQIAQRIDNAFQRAYEYCKTKKKLWEKVRQVFDLLPCMSMNAVYRFIAGEIQVEFPLLE